MNIKKYLFIFNDNLKCLLRKFLTVFISPYKCISCEKITYHFPLCSKCLVQLDNIAGMENRCSKCGKELISEKNICMDCRNDENVLKNVDFVFPLYQYKLWKKELLFQWKIKENRSLSKYFAKKIAQIHNLYFNKIPIVPVPPRPGKIKKNGWDQIQELCNYLEYYHNIRIQHVLKRINIDEQKSLNRKERLEHIEKAYIIKNNKIKLPEEIVLLDDISTTGATLESCGKILKNYGVKKIYGITLFSAD